MTIKTKKGWGWRRLPRDVREAWVEKKIQEKHAQRANDAEFQAKVDAQAYELLHERVAQFGADWHVNCAIRLPAAVKEAIAQYGTDVLLLMLDRDLPLTPTIPQTPLPPASDRRE